MLPSHRVLHSLLVLTLTSALAAAQVSPPEDAGRTFVLVVGVEDYQDPKITDLSYAEDDAQGVYDFFAKDPRSPTTKERVLLLRGEKATRVAVLTAIERHLSRQAVGPRDTAILYFAGHGYSDTQGVYLATSDTELDSLRYTAVSWSELQRLWSQIGAGRRLLFADACHSGGIGGLRGPGGIARRALAAKITKPEFASVVIAATGASELSIEDRRSKHGVFTAALLGGLRGSADRDRDGNVSLGELATYLTAKVPQEARKAGGRQTPTIRFNGSEQFARRLQLSDLRSVRLEAKRKAAEDQRKREEFRAKAELTAKRAREEAVRRIDAETRAARAEAEAAELRKEVAELKGKKAEATAAANEALEARRREAALSRKRAEAKVAAKQATALRRELESDPASSPTENAQEAESRSGFREAWGYPRAVARAKRLKGYRYLGCKIFASGGMKFGLARFKHIKTGLVFHLVPGGIYTRGSKNGESDEKPVREVTIQPFLLCATECTKEAWSQVMGGDSLDITRDQRPRALVSWTESQEFCRKAGLRLPSEAEWEYACRAGTTTAYSFGDNESELEAHAEFLANSRWSNARPVGGKKPNAFGLYDMHGNVWEWCEDVYADSYSSVPRDGSAHEGPGASERVLRGGAWRFGASSCRSASRSKLKRGDLDSAVGFRPARSLP